jgi:catechol 2,3-dioxygenase-like lactoylglutathione lyase family enzyme
MSDGTDIGLVGLVLVVKDLDRQRAFYRDVLELPLRSEYGSAAFFETAGARLALFDRGHHPEAIERLEGAAKGISHLEFAIPSARYEELTDRLRRAGHHAYRENFEDADRNLFHFVPDGRQTW